MEKAAVRRSLLIALTSAGLAFTSQLRAEDIAPLPAPITNNAVASVHVEGQDLVYSLMGLGADKAWDSITNSVNALNVKYNKWTAVRAVPGSGRLGASAVSARDQIFVLGGFVPDKSGMQAIVGDVAVYDPIGLHWYRAPDLLTPVRDAVVGVYRDRYIYVVGGFSPKGPTNEVQMYDVEAHNWKQATASPGAPAFGSAGAVVEDAIIYVDGAMRGAAGSKPGYVASSECWIGKIDHKHPEKIAWNKLPAHPGEARYRIAAGGSDKDKRAYFAGGSAGIYDYSGVGVDGQPAEPSPVVFDFNLRSNAWETIPTNAPASMDHRGLIVTSDGLMIIGGMEKDQKVSAAVTLLPKRK